MKKIYCAQCGKTIAIETKEDVQIKCSGKHEGKKCGHVNSIKKVEEK